MLESEVFNLLEHTTDAAFAVTEQGEILSWNKAAEALFGYSASKVLHKTCYKVLEGIGPLGTRVCHEHCSVVECAGGKTEIPNFDMSVKTHSGERRWINLSTLVFENPRSGRRLRVRDMHVATRGLESPWAGNCFTEVKKGELHGSPSFSCGTER